MKPDTDTIIVCELSRISRKVKDIFDIVEKIRELGANIKSLKEEWLDTTTPTGKLLFTFIAGICQFERDMIHERTMEGLKGAPGYAENMDSYNAKVRAIANTL